MQMGPEPIPSFHLVTTSLHLLLILNKQNIVFSKLLYIDLNSIIIAISLI